MLLGIGAEGRKLGEVVFDSSVGLEESLLVYGYSLTIRVFSATSAASRLFVTSSFPENGLSREWLHREGGVGALGCR